MIKNTMTALRFLLIMTVILGGFYPMLVTGASGLVFPRQASGSLIEQDGKVVGSKLIGQNFTGKQYLHARPSLAGAGYDPLASGGSNIAPSAKKEKALMQQRAEVFRKENGLAEDVKIPMDMLTASASGLDPQISPEAAMLQAKRIADARGISEKQVIRIIDENINEPIMGIAGVSTVNVLAVNAALDGINIR